MGPLLLLILAAARAAAPPAEADLHYAAPSRGGGVALADPWDAGVRARLDDAIDTEVALARLGLHTRRASLLYGVTGWDAAPDGRALRVAAVGWTRLDGVRAVPAPATRSSAGEPACGVVPGKDPVPTRRTVVLRRPVPRVAERESPTDPPQLVLGTADGGEVAIARLRPGDTLVVVHGSDPAGRRRAERIALARPGAGTLRLLREGDATTVCLDPP